MNICLDRGVHFNRPIPAGRDWLLWGDEYGKMKLGNVPFANIGDRLVSTSNG
jgi:hypothetical protein